MSKEQEKINQAAIECVELLIHCDFLPRNKPELGRALARYVKAKKKINENNQPIREKEYDFDQDELMFPLPGDRLR